MFRTLLLSAALVVSTMTTSQAQTPSGDSIRLGQVGLSFYAVVGSVTEEVLTAQGYTVEVTEGSHAEIFPLLGAGEVDMLAAAWLPNGHAGLYAPVETATFRVAPVYEDATFFWVVPSYVPEKQVSSVADLAKPDVVERMPERIVSLPDSTGLTIGARRVMEAYGLEDTGYDLVAGSPAEWIGAFRAAIEAEEWIVFPLWQPQWVNAAFDVRRLDEPQNAYGDPDTAWLIGHEGLRKKLDAETLAILSRIRLSITDVTEMDRLVNVKGMSPARRRAPGWTPIRTLSRAGTPSDTLGFHGCPYRFRLFRA